MLNKNALTHLLLSPDDIFFGICGAAFHSAAVKLGFIAQAAA